MMKKMKLFEITEKREGKIINSTILYTNLTDLYKRYRKEFTEWNSFYNDMIFAYENNSHYISIWEI